MPIPRFWLSTSVINGKIYAIGGSQGGGISLSTVEEYDPVTDKWTKKTNMPTGRYALSTSVVNGKIYVIGGSLGGLVPTSMVEEYDTGLAESIEAKGKHATSWGKVKATY